MKVGLIRHFKVKQELPQTRMLSAAELREWFKAYDLAPVHEKPIVMDGTHWETCFSSDLPRAVITARHAWNGEIHQMHDLQEFSADPFLRRNLRMPFLAWAVYARARFYTSHHSREFRTRVEKALDQVILKAQGPVLVVSHAVVMKVLRAALLRRGFSGQEYDTAENGVLYVFERKD